MRPMVTRHPRPSPPGQRVTLTRMRTSLILLLCTFTALAHGCAAPKPARFSIAPEQYDAAFAAAREALRDYHFDLARIDARAGVITTQSASSAGLATPWINHTDTLGDATTGLTEFERRRVEVRFLPSDAAIDAAGAATLPDPTKDVRTLGGPLTVDVHVVIERIYRPGRRPDATGVRLESRYEDPELIARGEQPRYAIDHRDDPRLAGRIASVIEKQISSKNAVERRTTD